MNATKLKERIREKGLSVSKTASRLKKNDGRHALIVERFSEIYMGYYERIF